MYRHKPPIDTFPRKLTLLICILSTSFSNYSGGFTCRHPRSISGSEGELSIAAYKKRGKMGKEIQFECRVHEQKKELNS